ncbi:hypothetical protein MMC18_001663 [Xylographa bjoerkii]|nr:hypothetical protein [Xylographa bjoerkii]
MAEAQSINDRESKYMPTDHTSQRYSESLDPNDPDNESTSSIWEQVRVRSQSGNYNFQRFESMQLLNLCLLQHDIRMVSKEIYKKINRSDVYPAEELDEEIAKLRPLLKDYNRSLMQVHEIMAYPKAAYETISKYDTPKIGRVPLLMTDLRGELEQDGVRRTVERLIPDKFKYSNFFSIGPRRELNEKWTDIPYWTKDRAEELEREGLKRLVDNLARLAIGVFGGAVLLAPMIIMVFNNSRNASLIITSVFVLFFASVLALGSTASNQEILIATAGYTAVLVVFIGTSLTSI